MEAVVDHGQGDGEDKDFADAPAEGIEDEKDIVVIADYGVCFGKAGIG
jgi:hypothetical protein